MTAHRCIEFEGQLSLFYFAVIKCFTHVIFFHVLHTLCVYFTKKGPVRLKFPNLKSVTISFAFKQSRKVFLFSRCLGQINCWTRMLWNKLPAKQNGMINLQLYESSVKAFTCLANWLDIFSICHVKLSTFTKRWRKLRHWKLLCFSAQSEGRTAATVWNWSGQTLSLGALLAVLYFSSCHIFAPVYTFPRPHYLLLGLRGCHFLCSRF